jgi:hypothetical protein
VSERAGHRYQRQTNDLPTSDAGWPQEALTEVTDVICLDDTPDVMHDLRVHPVGRPDAVCRIGFRHLALYDDQRLSFIFVK